MHARMHTRTHTQLSKIVTAMSRFTANGLNKKEQYSCLYSRAKPKVWLYLYSIHVDSCDNIQCNFTKVNIIVMSSITSVMSIFMLTLLQRLDRAY